MIRLTLAALATLAVGLSAASADELKGTLKQVNRAGHSLTLTVNGKDRVLPVANDATFVSVATVPGKKGKKTERETPIDGGLGALTAGSAVTVLTDRAGTRETVTAVKVAAGQPAKKKKAKKATAIAAGPKAKKASKAKGKKPRKAKRKAAKKKGKAAD
jgi:hypothetical protein